MAELHHLITGGESLQAT